MKCKISITSPTDIAAWVTKDAFLSNVDLDDLACRESREIHDWYHPDWFNTYASELHFTPPAFIFSRGRLRGINGRHRAVLLYRHLEVIPMLLVSPDTWPQDKLAEIMQQEIGEREPVELPDLPINMALLKSIKPEKSEVPHCVDIKINL
jgi:hypothetical protein